MPFQSSSTVIFVWVPPLDTVGWLTAQFPAQWYGPVNTTVSPGSNEAAVPASTLACVQGPPPPDDFVVGVGGGGVTPVHFGWPVDAACSSLAVVSGPTTPSTVSPAAAWKWWIAPSVSDPSLPSRGPALHPSVLSSRCSEAMLALLLVDVLAFSAVAPVVVVGSPMRAA